MNQVVQRIFCENHNKEIHFICCDFNCNQRLFCGQCLRNENHSSHSEKIFTLEEFINEHSDDVWQAFQKKQRSNFHIDELSLWLQQKKRDLIEVIEKEFKELEITLRNYSESYESEKEKVSEIQKVVKEYLQHQASASDVKSSFDLFKELFYQQISSFKEFDKLQFAWKQQQLQESFTDLKSSLFYTYEVVDDELLKELKQDMQNNLIQGRKQNNSHFADSLQREVENNNYKRQQNLQNQNSNRALLTRHVGQDQSSEKLFSIKLNKPIKQLKISFQNKVALPNPIIIKLINQKYEGILEIDQKQSVFLISNSNQLQNEKAIINLNEKKFSLILNKSSPFMILSMDDDDDNNNNTFIKLKEGQVQANVNNSQLIYKGESQVQYPTIRITISIPEIPQQQGQSNQLNSNPKQYPYTILTLSNYPSSLDLLGVQYQLE